MTFCNLIRALWSGSCDKKNCSEHQTLSRTCGEGLGTRQCCSLAMFCYPVYQRSLSCGHIIRTTTVVLTWNRTIGTHHYYLDRIHWFVSREHMFWLLEPWQCFEAMRNLKRSCVLLHTQKGLHEPRWASENCSFTWSFEPGWEPVSWKYTHPVNMGILGFPVLRDFRDHNMIIGTPFSTEMADDTSDAYDSDGYSRSSGKEWPSVKWPIQVV